MYGLLAPDMGFYFQRGVDLIDRANVPYLRRLRARRVVFTCLSDPQPRAAPLLQLFESNPLVVAHVERRRDDKLGARD